MMSSSTAPPEQPPTYNEAIGSGPYLFHGETSHDPRSSSTQSLVPTEEPRDGRRELLLIYIHGFMGDETSFRSFPAHVHGLVTLTLADSHIVHTKIYPKYKSRRSLDLVSEDFSSWLIPHESYDTDIILLGHSMGGLLSTEVALLSPQQEPTNEAFRHRILGTINFDVPFLGLHPGVVSSGLSSIFKPSPQPTESPFLSADQSNPSIQSFATLGFQSDAESVDRNFNPSFANDINLPIRKGWMSTMHFINKHSDGLRQATKQYVKSHIEFGGAMADYRGLNARYNKIRALEDHDENYRRRAIQRPGNVPMVRFTNYYTVCNGRPKKPKVDSPSQSRESSPNPSMVDLDLPHRSLTPSTTTSLSRTPSPRISVEEHRDDEIVPMPLIEPPTQTAGPVQTESIKSPVTDEAEGETLDQATTNDSMTQSVVDEVLQPNFIVQMPNLPPLPPPPTEPTSLDLTPYPDKMAQNIIKKEHERTVKAFERAVKDREDAIKDRKKLEDKLRKAAAKELMKKQKAEKLDSAEKSKQNTEAKKQGSTNTDGSLVETVDSGETSQSRAELPGSSNTLSHTEQVPQTLQDPDNSTASLSQPSQSLRMNPQGSSTSLPHLSQSPSNPQTSQETIPEGKKREKHFCALPAKNSAGERDSAWIRVFMDGVDEVGAHCGLFVMNDPYERLVGDVGAKIEEWVREDATRRMLECQSFR